MPFKKTKVMKIPSIILIISIQLDQLLKSCKGHRQILPSEGSRVPSVANHSPGNSGYRDFSLPIHRGNLENLLSSQKSCVGTSPFVYSEGQENHTKEGKERLLRSFPLVNLGSQQRMSVSFFFLI